MAGEVLRTSVATEVGCPYGKRLEEAVVEIRATAEQERAAAIADMADQASGSYHRAFALEAMQSHDTAEERLRDVASLEGTLDGCDNCHGRPEAATMTQEPCPVAQYAIYRMTLEGNRELGRE